MSGKSKDTTGMKFGKLTVIREIKEANKLIKVLCRCECGNEKIICKYNVTNGRTKSCGCIHTKPIIGETFGKLTVIEELKGSNQGETTLLCKCECGNEKVIRKNHVTSGKTQSCGCFRKGRKNKHDLRHTRIYNIWASMKQRCTDEKCKNYERYGGRGIFICDSWKTFINFYEDMKEGYSDTLSLERINNNDGYYKENCRWATSQEQALNRRSNRIVEVNGEKMPITKACEVLGIPYSTVRTRLYRGWSLEKALSKK